VFVGGVLVAAFLKKISDELVSFDLGDLKLFFYKTSAVLSFDLGNFRYHLS